MLTSGGRGSGSGGGGGGRGGRGARSGGRSGTSRRTICLGGDKGREGSKEEELHVLVRSTVGCARLDGKRGLLCDPPLKVL